MIVSPNVLAVLAAHIEAVNAKNGSKAQRAAFRRRDRLALALDDDEASWLKSVCNAGKNIVGPESLRTYLAQRSGRGYSVGAAAPVRYSAVA